MNNPFVINRLRKNPVEYSVVFSHVIIAGEWCLGVEARGVEESEENKHRIAVDMAHGAYYLYPSIYEQKSREDRADGYREGVKAALDVIDKLWTSREPGLHFKDAIEALLSEVK